MNRIGIFVFYDRDGIVDTYVEYFLTALKKYLKKLIIVCNGNLSAAGKERLEQFAEDIFVRDNTGYDAMAYKLGMTEFIGWKKLKEYDELLLVNDTFYGPLYSLKKLFDEMEQRECDFWGITCHKEYTDYYSDSTKGLPAYIQSYFMGFRKKIIQSEEFQDYWNRFDSTGWIFSDVLNRHEKVFTYAMEKAGFVWDTYVHAAEYEEKNPKDNFVQYFYIAHQLIKDYGCPIIKKKNFTAKRLTENPGELGNDTSRAFMWIKENTDYDTDMIWENLLRLYDVRTVMKALNLNYIISEHSAASSARIDKIDAFVCLREALTEQENHYIHLLKAYMNIIYVQDFKERDESLSHIENEDGLILLLIDEGKSAKTALRRYASIEEQWGNLAGNCSYSAEIIRLFDENKRLGVLLAPCGIHGADFGKSVTEKLRGCLALWCRKNIFHEMQSAVLDFSGERGRISVEEYRIRFVKTAQQMGYYTAVGMKASYASMAYTNMEEMLLQIEKHTKSRYRFWDFGSYLDGDMFSFCEKYRHIFVYGAGDNGCRAARLIAAEGFSFSGFIVSDDQPEISEKQGFPVFKLSMMGKAESNTGIVISVANKKSQVEIKNHLRQAGFENIYLLDT